MTRQSKEKEILEEFEKDYPEISSTYPYLIPWWLEKMSSYAASIEGEVLAELKKQVEEMKKLETPLGGWGNKIWNKALDDVLALLSLNPKENE